MGNQNLLPLIIQLVQTHEFYGISENVEIAKGKYEYNRNLKSVFKQFKRRILSWKK